ncbi:MAG: hypothetical protein NVV74_01940 [Magnetospirillum sp.]|nr:hypothetical protein [Magnetospirillum sp.]
MWKSVRGNQMKNLIIFSMCMISFSFVTEELSFASDLVNDKQYADIFAKGSLAEGVICGVPCVRAKGAIYAESASEMLNPAERQALDIGAWYNFVNAHRMLDMAYKNGSISEKEKLSLSAQIRDIDTVIAGIGSKRFGWNNDEIRSHYNQTRDCIETYINEIIK